MTRRFPDGIEDVGDYLVTEAGSYLRNVIREPSITCEVCATPVGGYERCGPCNTHAGQGLALADRVGSLIYAVKYETQAYKIVHGYKNDRPGPGNEDTMRALLALGLRGHVECAMTLSGHSDVRWSVVPSTRKTTKLVELVRELARRPVDEIVAESSDDAAGRELTVGRWLFPPMPEIPGHVLVIDDSWVSGAHAQSFAAALKLAGVDQVSVLTVARILDSNWGPNPAFIRDRLDSPFDWRRCPWTGAECP